MDEQTRYIFVSDFANDYRSLEDALKGYGNFSMFHIPTVNVDSVSIYDRRGLPILQAQIKKAYKYDDVISKLRSYTNIENKQVVSQALRFIAILESESFISNYVRTQAENNHHEEYSVVAYILYIPDRVHISYRPEIRREFLERNNIGGLQHNFRATLAAYQYAAIAKVHYDRGDGKFKKGAIKNSTIAIYYKIRKKNMKRYDVNNPPVKGVYVKVDPSVEKGVKGIWSVVGTVKEITTIMQKSVRKHVRTSMLYTTKEVDAMNEDLGRV